MLQDSDDDILDEPSPLGLRLKKSPSLMELIETALNAAKKDEPEDAVASGKADKIKAANFPIHVLRIGSWEVSLRIRPLGLLLGLLFSFWFID